jgi:phosphoadenosine phosphosulfate reductase
LKILQFSGGKDSLAVLLLLKDILSEITVIWANSGDCFPETLEQMEKIKAICPNFIEVKGNQPQVISDFGYPVDVIPVKNYAPISRLMQVDRIKMQGLLECCYKSFLDPMQVKSKELGATMIIRGQKNADKQKSPVRSGDVIDGVEYWFPIQDWTDEQVMDFVKDSDLLSPHYKDANTSMDCMHCTAYLEENQWKLPYLEKHHPEVGKEVKRRLILIKHEISQDMQYLDSLIGETNG